MRLTCGSCFDGMGLFSWAFVQAGFDLRWVVEIEEDCRRVTAERFPGVKQYADVRDVGAHNLEPVDVVFGGAPCFVAGTLILTQTGLKPIEDIGVGQSVWTHQNRWRKVTQCFRRHASETVILRGGAYFGLRCTPEHPLYVSDGQAKHFYPASERCRGHWYEQSPIPPRWLAASEAPGKFWASPVVGGEQAPPPVDDVPSPGGQGVTSRGPAITPALMWVVGAWVGDGWIRRRNDRRGLPSGVTISCPREYVRELLARIDAAGLHASASSEASCDKLHVSSRALAEWLVAHFGEKCEGKRIPGWLYVAPEALRRAFVDGYAWTDGYEKPDGNRKIATINKELAVGTAILGTSLGYCCSVYHTERPKTTVIEGRTVNQQNTYETELRHYRKQTHAYRLGGHSFTRCRKATSAGPAEVFNLEVEEDNSYVADGIVSHNCQDWSHAGKRKGLAGKRSRLFDHLPRVAAEVAARFILFENVPGLLSQDDGEDFAVVLEAFTGCHPEVPEGGWDTCGFGFGPKGALAWRIFDAQWLGVPQRRKRVFVVVRLGDFSRVGQPDGRDAAGLLGLPFEILALQQSMCGDPAPRREARASVAPSVTPGARRASGNRSGATLHFGAGVREEPLNGETAYCLPASACGTGDGHGQGWNTSYVGVPPLADAERNCAGEAASPVAFQATGLGYWREGDLSLSASDDNQGNQIVLGDETPAPLMAHTKRHGHAMGTQQAAESGHLVTEPEARGVQWRGRGMELGDETACALRSGGAGHQGDQSGYVLANEPEVWQGHGSNVGPMGALRKGNGNEAGGVPFTVEAFVHPRQLRGSETSNQVGIKPGAEVSDALTGEGPGAVAYQQTAPCLRTNQHNNSDPGMEAQMLVAQPAFEPIPLSGDCAKGRKGDASEGISRPSLGVGGSGEPSFALQSDPASVPAVAFHVTADSIPFDTTQITSASNYSAPAPGDPCHPLAATAHAPAVATPMMVRRLTVTECLRLMGAPDWWLDLKESKPLSDSAKYRMTGNSGVVPCLAFIAVRIYAAELGLLDDPEFESICEQVASGDPAAAPRFVDFLKSRGLYE